MKIIALLLLLFQTTLSFSKSLPIPSLGMSCQTALGHTADLVPDDKFSLNIKVKDSEENLLDEQKHQFRISQNEHGQQLFYSFDESNIEIKINGLNEDKIEEIKVIYFNHWEDTLFVFSNCSLKSKVPKKGLSDSI
jgi:hypothetical protein